MNKYDILDKILTEYSLCRHVDKKLFFRNVCINIITDMDIMMIDELKSILFNDGFLKYNQYGNAEPFSITIAGLKHIEKGGYLQNFKDLEIKRRLDTETLNKFNRDKISFGLSIIAIIISILSLIISWLR